MEVIAAIIDLNAHEAFYLAQVFVQRSAQVRQALVIKRLKQEIIGGCCVDSVQASYRLAVLDNVSDSFSIPRNEFGSASVISTSTK